jgi:hypothetical protein
MFSIIQLYAHHLVKSNSFNKQITSILADVKDVNSLVNLINCYSLVFNIPHDQERVQFINQFQENAQFDLDKSQRLGMIKSKLLENENSFHVHSISKLNASSVAFISKILPNNVIF